MSSFFTSLISDLTSTLALNQGASMYLFCEEETLEFPVPVSSYKESDPNNNGKLNINNLGSINMIGKKGLKSVEIASVFPAQQYYFCVASADKPQNYIKKIRAWKNSCKPLRIMITDTAVDWPCLIESFEHGEDDGTSDVNFSLQLQEYIYLGGAEDKTVNASTGLKERKDTAADKLKSITVYPGDSLMDVAARAAGSNYQSVYKALAKSGGLNVGDVVTGSKNIIKAGGKNVQV